MSTLGQGQRCYLLSTTGTTGTTPVVSKNEGLAGARIVSFVLVANGTLDGAWKVEVSNDVTGPGTGITELGQPATAGVWVDITAAFVPAIVAVAHGTVATQTQYIQCNPLGARAVRVTFTPTAGTGNVQVIVGGGEY